MYPDKWIKENLEIEICGFMPLEEAARLNKIGAVYEVTFMYRGGTNRLKFFWPSPSEPSKEDMQREVEKFWPKGRIIAFYKTIDNEQQGNYMVCAPAMTENFHFMRHDDWDILSQEASEILDMIYEEEGEPISPVLNEDDGSISVFIEDHDTGIERQIFITEEGLRDWFGKSKSKDGKKGWVNVVTGDSCASDKPGEGVPKCVSSSKRASMSKSERKASAAKKRREDPGQQSKSGAAKPTNVKTDVKEEVVTEEKDKKSKGSGSKDACYHKVKSRYSVWPSAYASGALVKCRQKGAKNWGNSSKKEEFEPMDEACWKTHEQRGMKKKGGKMVPNCVRKGTVSEAEYKGKPKAREEDIKLPPLAKGKGFQGKYDQLGREYDTDTGKLKEDQILSDFIDMLSEDDMKGMSVKSGDKRSAESGAGMTAKGVAKYRRRNPGSKLKTAVTTPPSKLKPGSKAAGRRKSFCARSRGWDGERGKAARRRWNC